MRARFLLAIVTVIGAHATAFAQPITLAYTNTHQGFPEKLLEHAAAAGIELDLVHFETIGMQAELLRRASTRTLPDAVIMASDNLAAEALAFSTIPRDLIAPAIDERMVSMALLDDAIRGIPVIGGNQLLLFHNRSLAPRPLESLEEMEAWGRAHTGTRPIVWDHATMYLFLPFVLAYDGEFLARKPLRLDAPGMAGALETYTRLGAALGLGAECRYQCAFDLFAAGKAAHYIDGEWSIAALRARLGADLGIAPLPSVAGRTLRSVCGVQVLAFPNLGLTGPRRDVLERLAGVIQSDAFQQCLWRELDAIPASRVALHDAQDGADDLDRAAASVFETAAPLPVDPRMTVVWEALLKGYERHAGGVYDAARSAAYMQHLLDKSTGTMTNN